LNAGTHLKQVFIYDKEIFILLADSKNRLNELTSLINLLESKRIILILSGDSKATTHIAHQNRQISDLYPGPGRIRDRDTQGQGNHRH